MVERAARYLEHNAPDDLAAVRQFLVSHTFSLQRDDVSGLLAGAKMATAFDWVYDGLSEPERRAAMANIVATADSSRDFMLNGAPDINHNYTYMALRTLAVCGLVLKGEPEPFDSTASDYLSLAQSWIEGPGGVLDTWQAKEGAWAEGSHYTFHETLRTLIMMLHAYRSASGTDYLARIAGGRGNFLSGAGRYLIACTRPDLTFERLGDVLPSRAQAALTVPLTVEMLAAGVADPQEAARFRSFAAELEEAYGDKAVLPQFDWGMRVFHDPGAQRTPSYRSLPTALRLGNGTIEHIMLRSGWEPGSTLISIIAGDHYTDHQHFDKGHFLVYHRGGLAVDGGTYDNMYRPHTHWTDYACRTVAHNALLIFDPGQELPPGYSNDGGQLVLRGLQHHGDWQSWLSHARSERMDTSDVDAYETSERAGYAYVRCGLGRAYGEKVASFNRQFVYLPRSDTLIVLDRVRASDARCEKRWLLHFQERPEVDGHRPGVGITRYPGGSETLVQSRGQFSPGGKDFAYNGTLRTTTLLPAQRAITVVGGPGYEYYNTFEGANHPPDIPERAAAPRESGRWRVEVAPEARSEGEEFLHLLQIGEAGRATDRGSLIRDSAGKAVGVQVSGRSEETVVLFAAGPGGAPPALPIEYHVSASSRARHLLVQLPPGVEVAAEVNGRALFKGRVSDQGVLSFEDPSHGKRTITLKLLGR